MHSSLVFCLLNSPNTGPVAATVPGSELERCKASCTICTDFSSFWSSLVTGYRRVLDSNSMKLVHGTNSENTRERALLWKFGLECGSRVPPTLPPLNCTESTYKPDTSTTNMVTNVYRGTSYLRHVGSGAHRDFKIRATLLVVGIGNRGIKSSC